MSRSSIGRPVAALIAATALVALSTGFVSAHEERQIDGYDVEVGFVDEPVFVGQKSGLEMIVHKGDTAVTGLEATIKAEVIYQGQQRELTLAPVDGEDGTYRAAFIPTAAGPYTFHIGGTIEGQAVDESFTSSPTGFDEVQEVAGGQFPVQFPSEAELVADAKAGKDGAAQAQLALIVGAAGVVIGLVGAGLALSARRRPA
jgi:hypothetical protein